MSENAGILSDSCPRTRTPALRKVRLFSQALPKRLVTRSDGGYIENAASFSSAAPSLLQQSSLSSSTTARIVLPQAAGVSSPVSTLKSQIRNLKSQMPPLRGNPMHHSDKSDFSATIFMSHSSGCDLITSSRRRARASVRVVRISSSCSFRMVVRKTRNSGP